MFINIYYRHVHSKHVARGRDPNKKRPEWFSHENCFRNLINTISADNYCNRVNLHIVYDGTEDEFKNDFIFQYLNIDSIKFFVIFIKAGSDLISFIKTLHIANSSECSDEDVLYFLENDYLHQYNWAEKVFKAFESKYNFDYLSLYDHNDKYIYEMYDSLLSKILYLEQHHWRTAPSTCASFMCKKKTLFEDILTLTSGVTDYYFFTELIQQKNKQLITALPGLSTHCMSGYMSPGVNWHELSVISSVS